MPGGDVSSPPGDHPTHLGTRYPITRALYIKDTSIIMDNTEYSTHSTPINDGIFVLNNISIATLYVIIATVILRRKLLKVKCIAHLYHDFSLPIVNQKENYTVYWEIFGVLISQFSQNLYTQIE